jgi:hypothetical protein
MHLANLALPAILLVVMLCAFAGVDRYASRHPYGTGRFGEMERKRRAREAHRHGLEQRNLQGRQSNEVAIANLRARLRPEAGEKSRKGVDPGVDQDADDS